MLRGLNFRRVLQLFCLIGLFVSWPSIPAGAQAGGSGSHRVGIKATVNCSFSDWPFTNCLSIYGQRLNVMGFRVTRSSGGFPRTICNYSARVIVTYEGVIQLARSSGHHEGCVWYTAYVDFAGPPGGWNFPDGSEACGYFYVNEGRLTDGHPCATIHD